MTREEEIKQAAYTQYCNSESICFTLMCDSFKQGAKWADEHPKNIWHDASEEPQGKYYALSQRRDGTTDFIDYGCVENYYCGWKFYIKEENIVSWAYVSDLLPKGGEV